MAGALTATLAEGTYFLAVDGAGTGDAATAYNDYGSLGEYALSGTVAPTVNQPPVAVASGTPTTGVAPLAVTFSSNGTFDSGGAIASYSWVFGDGTTSTAANPAKTYTTAGTYQARLTVQDSGGLTATATVTITVTAPTAPPVAPIAVAAGTPTTGTVPLAVAFSSAGSSDPDGTIASYSWVFGDGTTSTAANPAKTYTTAGTYQATLTVRDASGLTGTSVVTITARAPNAAPVARAAANVTTGAAPLAVTFSSAGSSDSDGTIASYNWVFGDGTTSTAANPVKTYSTAGTFLATLRVIDNAGAASAAATVTITVQQATNRVFVTNIAMAGKVSRGARSATATVTVKNSRGALVSGAVVAGTWSGAVSRSVTAKTNSKGLVVFTSPTSTVAGTFTFAVTGITLSGWTYDSKSNVETTDFVRVQ
jgi:predicted outer membrane repeat protein